MGVNSTKLFYKQDNYDKNNPFIIKKKKKESIKIKKRKKKTLFSPLENNKKKFVKKNRGFID